MNYFSFFRNATVLKKTFSVVALVALFAGGLAGLVYTSTAYANNGVNTYAVPNTGTLVPGQTMDVHMTVTLDPNDTNPVTSPSCLVNGVQVANTFTNLTSGSDGHFRFTYTVGASDASRAAGQIPINCTVQQTGSVTVTAFDDGNTVAIDTAQADPGSNTGPGNNAVIVGSGASIDFPTSAVPNSGTLTQGQALEVHFNDSSATETTTATSSSCLVNDVNVAGTLVWLGTGHWKVTYTVGAGDASRTAGNVPIDCTLIGEQASVRVSRFNDSNTVAIDASSTGGGNTNTPQISSVSISPNTGTLQAGDSVTVIYQATDTATTDLAVSGLCHVNGQDVTSSFTNIGNGAYQFSYTVGVNDGERPAGHIPVSCTFSNSGGSVTATGWTDGNTVAIDTNGDGSIDNGTNNLGFTVVANPATGTLETGQSVAVSIQDPLPSADVVIGSAGCRVNDVDVSGSYSYQGNGLYRVTYTVGENDADRAAGQIPFDCTLQNHTGSVHLIAFTDSNTLAVNSVSSADTTPPTIASTTPSNGATNIAVDSNIQVNFSEAMDASTVNNSSFILTRDTGAVAGSVSFYGSTATQIFNPTENLSPGVTYTAHIREDLVKDAAGNPMSSSESSYTWTFTTAPADSGGGNGTTTPDTGGNGTTTPDTGGNGTTTATTTDATLSPTAGVEPVSMVESTATAGGGYADGWVWIFRVTVPNNETNLQMKFNNWSAVSGTSTIAAANNMRISSLQASSTSAVTITAADSYSSPALVLTGDLDPAMPGRQIEIKVEMQVPAGTPNGSYTTNYAIKSF